jgi:ABC-2 type transport system permease protein
MRVIQIALKDVRQVLADPRVLLFVVAMPLVFTLFMGFAYRSGESRDSAAAAETRIPLGWVNRDDGGLLATALQEWLSASDAVRVVDLAAEAAGAQTEDAVSKAIKSGEIAGALLVPAGFSAQAASGEQPQLTLIADTGSADGRALQQYLRGPLGRLYSASEIARLAAEQTGDEAAYAPALGIALSHWASTDRAPLVRLERAVGEGDTGSASWFGDNPYNQASPGILVQFAIMSLVGSSIVLLEERKGRTLERLMTTSLSRGQILAGHGLGMFTLTLLQILMLVVFGQLLLGVHYLREPLATALVSVVLAMWIAGMGLVIGVLARDDSQVVLFALMAMFIFSALGGTWFPLELAGGAFAAIGRVMPSAQAMAGYQNILMRGLGMGSVVTPVLALLAWALGFGALGWWFFQRLV